MGYAVVQEDLIVKMAAHRKICCQLKDNHFNLYYLFVQSGLLQLARGRPAADYFDRPFFQPSLFYDNFLQYNLIRILHFQFRKKIK